MAVTTSAIAMINKPTMFCNIEVAVLLLSFNSERSADCVGTMFGISKALERMTGVGIKATPGCVEPFVSSKRRLKARISFCTLFSASKYSTDTKIPREPTDVISVTKELKATDTALVKARANKKAILEELALLKAAAQRLNAYTKAIATADKALNKPVKKKRARKKST